jgi:hypothetical protein
MKLHARTAFLENCTIPVRLAFKDTSVWYERMDCPAVVLDIQQNNLKHNFNLR